MPRASGKDTQEYLLAMLGFYTALTEEELTQMSRQHAPRDTGRKICSYCGVDYPCPIIRVVMELRTLRQEIT